MIHHFYSISSVQWESHSQNDNQYHSIMSWRLPSIWNKSSVQIHSNIINTIITIIINIIIYTLLISSTPSSLSRSNHLHYYHLLWASDPNTSSNPLLVFADVWKCTAPTDSAYLDIGVAMVMTVMLLMMMMMIVVVMMYEHNVYRSFLSLMRYIVSNSATSIIQLF